MAKVDQSSKEYKDRLKAQQARTKQETKKREKAAGSSIKAGLKAAARAVSSGGMADRAAKAARNRNKANKKSLDY